MPFYRYSAIDPSGKMLDGTIQGGSPMEAIASLSKRGYKSVRVMAEVAAPAAAPAPAPAARQVSRTPATGSAQPSGIVLNRPAAPAPVAAPAARKVIHTKRAKDKEIYFIFAMLADQLRAGMGPAQIFIEMARLTKNAKFRSSFNEIAESVSHGGTISEVCEIYPDLYPPHVTGMLRAAEAAGFLPDACATISEQAFNSWKFARFHWWAWVVVWNGLLSFPLVLLVRFALLRAFDRASQGETNPYIFGQEFANLLWPYGPITLAVYLVLYLLHRFYNSRSLTELRHKVVLSLPVMGARARNESVTVFSWTLAKLSRGGMPPHNAWPLAMAAVPNLAVREKLRDSNRRMHEGSRISDALFESKLFPDEYAPTVSTGELTGDVSGSLERLANVSRTEFEASTVKAKAWNGTLGCLGLIAVTGIVTIILTYAWYREIHGKVLNEIESAGQTQSQPAPQVDPATNPEE